MVFSSSVFLFFFLPLCLIIDFLLGIAKWRRARNLNLLAFSLLFYAYGEGYYIILMLVSIVMNWLIGLMIAGSSGRAKSSFLAVGVILNLLLLTYYKYFGFLMDNVNALGLDVQVDPVHLPIGISFFTFQAISYIVDLHRGRFPVQRNPLDLGLYIAMFPQLVAGPIVRYESIQAEITERTLSMDQIIVGVKLFCVGLFQKVIIADTLAKVVDSSLANAGGVDFTTPMAWLFTVSYALQIFFDFAGYSLMALGLGRIFGFTFPKNFDQPYISTSVREFWRRWHISLSSWFRDYLYIPLGGSRGGELMTYRNLLIIFFVTGIWHGASWNFVFWGLFHGFFIVLERTKVIGGFLENTLPRFLQHIYLLLVVLVAWVFFRIETFGEALAVLRRMFVWTPGTETSNILGMASYYLNAWVWIILALGIVWAFVSPEFAARFGDRLGPVGSRKREVITSCGALVLMLASIVFVVAGSYTSFIYFRF